MKGTLERQDHSLGDWELCVCRGWVCVATPWVGTQGSRLQSLQYFGAKNVCSLIEWGLGQGMSGFPKEA